MKITLIIEIIGATIGLIYLYLEYKASFWLWSAGIIMSLFYIYIYFNGKFYADMAIYAYYLGANVYGLILWKDNLSNKKKKKEDRIRHAEKEILLKSIPLFLILFCVIFLVLKYFTDSPVALGDSLTTSLSIIAMWLMAKKYIEHWVFWVVINIFSTGLYFWKGLYPTAGLFIIYTIVSIMGYFKWIKLSKSAE